MTDWLKYLPTLSPEQMSGASNAAEQGSSAEAWLRTNAGVNDKDILRAKSVYFRLPYVTLAGYHPSQEAIELITEEQARKLGVIPLFCLKDRIFVAMPDPYDLRCEDFIRKLTGRRVKPVLAGAEDMAAHGVSFGKPAIDLDKDHPVEGEALALDVHQMRPELEGRGVLAVPPFAQDLDRQLGERAVEVLGHLPDSVMPLLRRLPGRVEDGIRVEMGQKAVEVVPALGVPG